MPGAGVTLSLSLSLSCFSFVLLLDLPPLCSTLVSPLPSLSNFSSSSSSLPPTEREFILRFLHSRSFPKFYKLYLREEEEEEEEAEFRSAEHPPSGGAKKRIISAPSFLLEVENDFHAGKPRQPVVDDREIV